MPLYDCVDIRECGNCSTIKFYLIFMQYTIQSSIQFIQYTSTSAHTTYTHLFTRRPIEFEDNTLTSKQSKLNYQADIRKV